MESGTVVSLVLGKGYGFIFYRKGEDDLFFHMGDLVGLDFDETLKERRVRFDIRNTPKGLRAENIQAAS